MAKHGNNRDEHIIKSRKWFMKRSKGNKTGSNKTGKCRRSRLQGTIGSNPLLRIAAAAAGERKNAINCSGAMTPLCEALAWLPVALNDAGQSHARTAH